MPEVACKRCGTRAPGLDRPPLPGAAGTEVAAGTCRSCWAAWLVEQVKRINEQQLTPADPEHYARLVEQMRTYLGLG